VGQHRRPVLPGQLLLGPLPSQQREQSAVGGHRGAQVGPGRNGGGRPIRPLRRPQVGTPDRVRAADRRPDAPQHGAHRGAHPRGSGLSGHSAFPALRSSSSWYVSSTMVVICAQSRSASTHSRAALPSSARNSGESSSLPSTAANASADPFSNTRPVLPSSTISVSAATLDDTTALPMAIDSNGLI